MIAVRVNQPTETEEQIALFTQIALKENRYPLLRLVHMVPNGARLPATYKVLPDGKRIRFSREGDLLKRMGLRPGVPDIACPVPGHGYHGLYIELKRLHAKPSDTTPEQRQWHTLLREVGQRALVCRGWIDAWNVLVDHLGLPQGEHIA